MSVSIRAPEELFWVSRYDSFKARGYLLRPRYHPDWKPSWKPGDASQLLTEEIRPARMWPNVMDAIKLDETKKVVLKHMTDANELVILKQLSLATDKRNHTVPPIEFLFIQPDETGPKEFYLVMPFLRRAFEAPNFERLGEVLTALHQFLVVSQYLPHY
ncbi:hypothetical protein FB451DRAFT_1510273 [Mycena latifolia]|nr:hypothetical protein FB451DRAFT_1510273 [Mycena latifolia]